MSRYRVERHGLQFAVFVAAFVPVLAGGAGMLKGTSLFDASDGIDLDSHYRYLSGLLFGLGITFWRMIPTIEQHTTTVRTLTSLIVIGGLARLAACVFVARPSLAMELAIGMELVVTPLLCLWQARVSRLAPKI